MVYNGNPRPVLLLVTHLGSEVTGHMGIAWCDCDDTFRLSCNTFITDAKLVPLLPMIIGITSLSVILLFDKRDDENREWAFPPGDLQNKSYRYWQLELFSLDFY